MSAQTGNTTASATQQQSKASGLGLLTVLQTDLRSISQEARTKFPAIKDAIERGILKLKYIEDQSNNNENVIQALSRSEDVLKPFLLACESKNQKMISIAIGSILKLISQSAVSINTLPSILAKMAMLIDVGSEEQIQLKVLQGLLILITTLHDLHDDLLAQCLVLCFRLHSSKNSSIQKTSSATLPQIIRIIFDRVVAEINQSPLEDVTSGIPPVLLSAADDSPVAETVAPATDDQAVEQHDENTTTQQDSENTTSTSTSTSTTTTTPATPTTTTTTSASPMANGKAVQDIVDSTSAAAVLSPAIGNRAPSSLKPCARDAYLLLQDLCHISGGDNPAWLPPTTSIARATGLELIEMIISLHQIFTELEEFRFLLKDRVCPLLIKSFKFKMDFFHTVRLMRVIVQFISKYSVIMVTESDVLLNKCIRMLESDNPSWMQVLALESFKVYSEDPSLLRMFYKHYDKDNNAAKIFENMASNIGRFVQTLYTVDSSNYVFTNTGKNRLIDLLWQPEPPHVKESYIISVCTECITGIVNSVAEINNPELRAQASADGDDVFPQMANSCWVSVLAAISMLLGKAVDETLIQIILKSLQSFTNTCGELHLSAPRDALLTCLCKTTIPPSQDSALNESGEESGGRGDKLSNSSSDDKKGQANASVTTQFYPTNKNILAVKTLLNIAHCMGSVLDEAWILVLETLEVWDRVLKSMHQSQQQDERSATASSSPRIGQGEVPILSTAMNSLFKSSSQLDEKSVNFLFEALAKLCTNSLNKSPSVYTNMFSIKKLVEASLANLHRVDKLWGYISTHLEETCNYKNNYVRLFGVESLTTIIKSALSLPAPPQHDGEDDVTQEASFATRNISTNLSSSAELEEEYVPMTKRYRSWNIEKMQVQFMNAIEEISFSQHVDTKEKILESIHQILSSSGQTLSTGWPILLSVLLRVAQNSEKPFIPVAFESLKLICNEFLSNLTPECLVLTIEVILAFGSQRPDINIGLTASTGLLLDLTYFLAKEKELATSKYNTTTIDEINQMIDAMDLGQSDEPTSTPVATTSNKVRARPKIPLTSPFFTERQRSVLDRMWLCAFSSMKILCIDSRPAIRNGVIVSLFQNLATFLHLLDKELIETILWKILFPLIDEVKQCTDLADKDRIDSDLGSGVQLLVHHSRNTAQKQWDETLVIPISRMIITFKTFFDTLSQLPTFNKAWERLLDILETESKSSSKEVSMAAITSLHEIVNSSITDATHPDLCESVWETLLRLSTRLTDPAENNSKTLFVYIKVFTDLFHKAKATLDHAQMIRVLQIIYPLGLYISESPSEISNPQVHMLQLIKSLLPIKEELFPSVVTILLKYISIGIQYDYAPTASNVIFPTAHITKDLVYYTVITEKSMELICELFQHSSTNNSMRASIYEDILKVFGAAMMTKYSKYHSNIWKISVLNLIKILPQGLLSINEDSGTLNDIKRNIIWTELIDSIQTFILHERVGATTMSQEKRNEEDRYDVDLINAISNEMVCFSGIRVERVSIIRDRLVEILCEGSMLSSQGREKVSQACYQNMFSICSKASSANPESIEIAKIIMPVILKRCKDVLQRFVIDERQSGQCPLPRHRLTEVSFILREIQNLQLEQGIYQPSKNVNKREVGRRPHLMELFTILSDCICTSEKEVKELLKNIFYIVANEYLFLE
ncbi:hypothetical protein SAMD00019534_047780 [Acytostelium subglobosum LB1]|uniref:hypothetical protein n=1 Tax=Acytostelium subglobosum LB1 TaxID=1410327 RepID=UPI000644ED86|nr:hypothetical protein SAMD00019534_047780 [Acytostelium subglobosum LB1]GAM21603.1 hypothetical protein SAMD00019534_047780 [Acytostelium subglobosum LB1]|eukprot:XP_012755722.1 hypothetical protein SAMD00019534_047780 [Acytostelium subglobosum LB1]